jgi:hypothetical protein
MEDDLEEVDFVLSVCSSRYYNRYRGRGDPEIGRGARWESSLTRAQPLATSARERMALNVDPARHHMGCDQPDRLGIPERRRTARVRRAA